MTTLLHERIVAAAVDLTVTDGWERVTMATLARRVGVSRQTVYNEVGTRSALAEAMIQRELTAFLVEIDAGFTRHPSDVRAATRDVVEQVLTKAAENPLLQAVLSSAHGAASELLPLITTDGASLIEQAAAMVDGRLRRYDLPLRPAYRRAVVDVLVRTVLSHAIRPGAAPRSTARRLADVFGAALAAGS